MRPPVPVAAVRRVVPQRVTAVEPAETSFDIKPDEIVTAFSEPASPTTLTGSEARNAAKDEQAVRQKLHSYRGVSGRDVQPVLSGSRGGLRDRRVPRHDDAGAEPGEPGTDIVRTSVDVQDAPRCWCVEDRRGLAIFADRCCTCARAGLSLVLTSPPIARESRAGRSRRKRCGAGRNGSRKLLRRPATGRASLNGRAARSDDVKPEQQFSGLRSGFRSERPTRVSRGGDRLLGSICS